MQKSANKKPAEVNVGESEKQDYQTPEVYEVNSLRIDTRLPHLKIRSESDTIFSNYITTEIAVELPDKISNADIFLFNNGKKKDMYYQVGAGVYSFHHVLLDNPVNNLEFFYRLGNRRSLPEKLVVIKKTNR
ncbi:MAG TPA: hypothetical protein VLB50_04900 [Ignavibacteriaceae bacterium]|nr:hypothetical protein [Ignavibacteriaceae bacterium]